MSDENITVSMGPVKMFTSVILAIGAILGGTYGIVNELIDNRISIHTSKPHPVTVRRAEEIAKQVLTIDKDGTKALRTEIGNMQIKQAGFGTDIVWIKDQQLRQDRKLDKILDAIQKN